MKIYSPSQTKIFLECPVKWLLSKQWKPRTFSKMDLYAVRGSAVSAYLECILLGQSGEGVVEKTVYAEWDRHKLDNREFEDQSSIPYSKEELVNQANLIVKAYKPMDFFKVLHTEYTLKRHGYARPDVIAEDRYGEVFPLDFKVRDEPVRSYYKYTTMQDYEYDWQMYHYVMGVSEEFKECRQFAICMFWFNKVTKVELKFYHVKEDRYQQWLSSARKVWKHMEAIESGEEEAYEVAEHGNKFGPCKFHKACLTHNRDESLMVQDYEESRKR